MPLSFCFDTPPKKVFNAKNASEYKLISLKNGPYQYKVKILNVNEKLMLLLNIFNED